MKNLSTKKIASMGIMAAAVYVASAFLQIPIPTVIGSTRLHMGNVVCLLSGMLLGPMDGGIAAGVGSMLFDLTNPAYVASAPFTFLFKFIMAWVCGKLVDGCRMRLRARCLSGAVLGSVSYMVLYLAKNFVEHRFVAGLPLEAVFFTILQKAAVSGVNAAVAVVVAVPLGISLKSAIARFL